MISENTTASVSGVAVQAGAIHGDVTIAASAWRPPPVPRQLPPTPVAFINRTRELAAIESVRTSARVLVLTGIGGVGKTGLALEWAHRSADAYPDGQLHLPLGGASGTPAGPGEVVASALRGLGVDPAFVPRDIPERIALLRSLTHRRRLLVLADDAASTEQVRPLIPAGPGSVLVVTARTRLTPLLSDGARFIHIKPLPEIETADLLGHLLPDSPHRTSLASVAARCAGMPLAVHTAAGILALLPDQPTDAIVSLLTQPRPLRPGSTQEAAMDTILESAYQQVPDPAAQRLYRLLGLHPGTRYTADAAAALTAARDHDHPHQQARALRVLAEVENARGNCDREIELLEEAHAIFNGLHAPEAAPVADRLARLGRATP